MKIVTNEITPTQDKPKFEPLVLVMFFLLLFGLGWINIPLGIHVIKKIKKSNGTLRGLGLTYFFIVMGCIFIIGLISAVVIPLLARISNP